MYSEAGAYSIYFTIYCKFFHYNYGNSRVVILHKKQKLFLVSKCMTGRSSGKNNSEVLTYEKKQA